MSFLFMSMAWASDKLLPEVRDRFALPSSGKTLPNGRMVVFFCTDEAYHYLDVIGLVMFFMTIQFSVLTMCLHFSEGSSQLIPSCQPSKNRTKQKLSGLPFFMAKTRLPENGGVFENREPQNLMAENIILPLKPSTIHWGMPIKQSQG